ncbi:MAG: amidohydrolase, partial [Gammaproteobacteria bacterium]|nr:amidohydrolase [Gammaproteobacteria bacterium]
MRLPKLAILSLAFTSSYFAYAAEDPKSLAEAIESDVIEWRHDIHRNPELSNREFRTAQLVAEHLNRLGISVETGVAHTGVVGVLDSGKPGPTIA